MKYFKMLGLLTAATVALMAFAGNASATLTSPAGTAYSGEISAESSNTALDGSVNVSCAKSTISLSPSSAGATSGSVSTLTFTECGKDTVTVLNKGTLSTSSNGLVTSTGAEITVLTHRILNTWQITMHCIYKTNNTTLGTLLESTGSKTATLEIGSSPIPEVATDAGCGNDAVLTGSYTISTPDYLAVD